MNWHFAKHHERNCSQLRTSYRQLRMEALEPLRMLSHLLSLSTTEWEAIGPAPISTPGIAQDFSAGRIEAAAPHPTDSNVMYIGADAGGIWKTATWNRSHDDGGAIWLPLTDDQPSLDFSGYHPLLVVPGKGDTIMGVVSGPGAGVLKSTNGGLGWQLLGNAQLDGASIGSITVSSENLKTLYISVRSGGPGGGVYRSLDGGSSWQNTTPFHSGGASDVIMDPFDPEVLYAGLVDNVTTAGVYKSVDGGANWSLVSSLANAFVLGNTVRLEPAPSAEGTVYATLFQHNDDGDIDVEYYRTTDATNWDRLATPAGAAELRSWHVLTAVDPNDADHVFVNRAYEIFESVDGGQSWNSFENIGEDWVFMTFDAENRPVATGDRNLYSYDTELNRFDSREGNLQVTEFYTITLDPLDVDIAYGVAQDHFDAIKFDESVLWAYTPQGGGEAGQVLVHPNDSDILYVSHPLDPDELVRRSTDGGQTWTTILMSTDFEAEDYSLAYSAQKSFVMDPTNPSRLLIGTTKVFETTNADSPDPTWTEFSPLLTTSTDVSDQYITALATSSDGQSVYAATSDGHVSVKHPNEFWVQSDMGLFGQGAGNVVDIEVDPSNPMRAFAVTNGPGGTNIWYRDSEKNIGNWTNVSGNFPTKLRTATIHVDWQYGPAALFVGTNRGVYISVNFGQNWQKFGQHLPNTVVTDLQYDPVHHILAAGTYGRGVWEILVAPSTISGQVYWDVDSDATMDASEGGMAAVLVYLDANGNGAHDAFEKATFSDADGLYVLSNVAPGTYDLRQIPPAGFTQTTQTFTNLTFNGVNQGGYKFGNNNAVIMKFASARQFDHLIEVFEARADRQLERLQLRRDTPIVGRSYSPHAFGPGEMRLQPKAVDSVLREDHKPSDEEPYTFLGDLNDLPGRLPGEPIGAEGEFEHRLPTDEPQRLALLGHQSGVTTLALAPDDRILASAGRDDPVTLWELTADKSILPTCSACHDINAQCAGAAE